MSDITFSPRLRNASINGIRFHTEPDPVIKKNLENLDEILGKPVFKKKEIRPVDDDLTDLEKEYKEALSEKELANESAKEAKRAADDAESTANQMESYSKYANGTESDYSPRQDSEGAGLNDSNAESRLQDARSSAASKRKIAGDLEEAYINRKKRLDDLELIIANKSVLIFNSGGRRKTHFDLEDILPKPLLPKGSDDLKNPKGFLAYLKSKPGNHLSISDCIDQVKELSNLKNSFQQYLNRNWNSLGENQKAVLNNENYKNISDYLLAYGYWVKGITEVSALFNFVKTHKSGANAVVDYLAISSAREIVEKKAIEIPGFENDDNNSLIIQIREANLSFSVDAFSRDLDKMLDTFIESGSERSIIENELAKLNIDIKKLPASYIPKVIKYFHNLNLKIDATTVPRFLPIVINDLKGTVPSADYEMVEDLEISDKDFDVEFIEDERNTVITSVSNVLCASQLFSAAIMEMDLDIFNLTNYLTNNYLVRNRIDLEDRRLRQNLQMFVFSNRFIDKSGQVQDRTKPGERQHFYRQVFNVGNGPAAEGIIINQKFPKLWKQLIPEVKTYLENAASSLSENTFVSKGGVMQIVSGLQNNLSANCTSMAKIISPIINGEWNFIISKILGHPEIVKQVSPAVPSWKGVAETLYGEMIHSYTDASLVYDKVRISNAILKKVAEYDPRKFEEDENFMTFCSMVIQLDDVHNSLAMETNQFGADNVDDAAAPYLPKMNGQEPPVAKPGNNDWDF